ncbi:hypothetical protein NQ317_004756 [Molorchus minor]|uniref:PiggyBac transposable element-derived protein domain-containing protein n=1 Tax=Molorchus minor TaxID=1323400 RepID=A0ABQ9JGD8_9CUCU|nr:hypothetical protein NQ317_004756 [Molorchus minor]
MDSSAGPSTHFTSGSRCKRKRDDDQGLCGLTRTEYNNIVACLDPDEEPYIDSGSEYEPDRNECETSDEEAEDLVYDENDSPDEMEPEQNDDVAADDIDNSNIQEHIALPKDLSLKWSKTAFVPNIHPFDDSNSGAHIESVEDKSNALSYFLLFINPEVVELVVQETNRYALENKENTKQKWKDTTENEMYVFLAVMLLTARHGKNNIKEHWSTDALLHTPIFSQVMPRNRWYNATKR